MKYRAPKGTRDIWLPEITLWQRIESTVREVASLYGYGEIRTPIFESVELFERSVGEETDIVNKEMYVFQDRGGRMMALRPEGTASVVRAYLQNRMGAIGREVRLYYIGPMFRYERPQKGRCRQLHQFGVELLGSDRPEADIEVISFVKHVYDRLELKGTCLKINSVGCPVCRPVYHENLCTFLVNMSEGMCDNCSVRARKNPLRVFDCKSRQCQSILNEAPSILDYLCSECVDHHKAVKEMLSLLAISFEEDVRLVRGLDYYTRTAFEFIHGGLGSQDAVGGGGRYDGLVEELGGQHVPAVGFAGGLERLILLLSETQDASIEQDFSAGCFIAAASAEVRSNVQVLAELLRRNSVTTVTDTQDRSLKSQMKLAGKYDVKAVVILGFDECEEGTCLVKNMITGKQRKISQNDIPDVVRAMSNTGDE